MLENRSHFHDASLRSIRALYFFEFKVFFYELLYSVSDLFCIGYYGCRTRLRLHI